MNSTHQNISQPSESKRWKLVLASRPSSTPPSDLEILLRTHCFRLKVVEKLNGAHIVIPMTYSKPGGGGTISKTLAVRYYSAHDLQHLHSQSNDHLNRELDTLKRFASSFAMSLIFFECPSDEEMIAALDSPESFPRQAMHQLTTQLDHQGQTDCLTNIVESGKAAIDVISTVAGFMGPEKSRSREAYFRKQEILQCVPLPRSSSQQPTETPQQQEQRARAQSNRVCQALREWARDFDLPMGEEDVLMHMAKNLQTIATPGRLGNIPIEESTRIKIQKFFDTGEIDPNHATFDSGDPGSSLIQFNDGPGMEHSATMGPFDQPPTVGAHGAQSFVAQSDFGESGSIDWDGFTNSSHARMHDSSVGIGRPTLDQHDQMHHIGSNNPYAGQMEYPVSGNMTQHQGRSSSAPFSQNFPPMQQDPFGAPLRQSMVLPRTSRMPQRQPYRMETNNAHYQHQQGQYQQPFPSPRRVAARQSRYHAGSAQPTWSQAAPLGYSGGGGGNMPQTAATRPRHSMPNPQFGAHFRQWM